MISRFVDKHPDVLTLEGAAIPARSPVCNRTARNDGQSSESLPHTLIPELENRGCRVVEVSP